MASSPLFDPTVSVPGVTYPRDVPDVAGFDGRIGLLETANTGNQSDIGDLQDDVSAAQTDISDLETGIADLSGVTSAATARSNIGAGKGTISLRVDSLVGTNTYRVPAPDYAITITKIKSVINAALATGDATLTAKINASAITTGVVTITQSGSAEGDQDEASPTAANVTDGADDLLAVTVGGTNSSDIPCMVLFEYTY
jgi:hypothetical protein